MSTTATRTAPRLDGHPRVAGWGIGRPASAASRLSTAIAAIRSRVATVAEPMWGRTTRFGAVSSGSSAGSGSGSVTSSAAAAIAPPRSAAARATWSTIGAAGGVHEDRARAHRGERVRVDQVARPRASAGRGALTTSARASAAWRSSSRPTGSISIPKAAARCGDGAADPPEADDRQARARAAPGPSQPRGSQVRQPPLADGGLRLGQPARGGEQQRHARGPPWRRSARPASRRRGSRARRRRRGRCCRSRPRSWRSRAAPAPRRAPRRRCGR